MKIFDYIFYRLNNLYASKEKYGSSVFTAALYVSFLEFLTLYSIVVTFQVVTNDSFLTREFLQQYKPYSKYGLLLIFFLFEIFNYLRYRKMKTKEALQRRFKNHFMNKIIKPWMFIILGAFLFGLPILVHYFVK
ncbi:MAG: hypothetical protein A2066_02225 [Bacteroidetes bacterium GWB2_41_8]|nr:MAG: hypothetical protein A2066_02225 [Bacteroidetes bacterium GWB2_41_8]